MPALDAIVLRSIEPADLIGLESYLLGAVASRTARPALVIYAMPARLVSIGRYHLYDGVDERGGIAAMRRLTGGRIVGAGEGWLGVALILPTRTSLLAQERQSLKPEQVMNRYVRGVLVALRGLGIDCFYPGRDAITRERREIGACTFETDASGAMLFEAMLAVNRGMEDVVHDLERFDPNGAFACPMYGPHNATTVAREVGREVRFDELVRALIEAYAPVLGEVERRELSHDEAANMRGRSAALKKSGWFTRRVPDDSRPLVGRVAAQLGAVEAHVGVGPDGKIRNVTMAGDLIANSTGLSEFENELVGRPLDLASVTRAVEKTYGDGTNYVLGLGELDNLVKLVANAQ
ncbi:MAG: lipoyl protein ligase domain-containing protein [Candidatus Binataceae bacterium]